MQHLRLTIAVDELPDVKNVAVGSVSDRASIISPLVKAVGILD